MHISALAGTLALIGLAACTPSSGGYDPLNSGVGFGDYQQYLRQREAVQRADRAPYSVPPEPARQSAILPPEQMPDAPPSTLDTVPARYVAAPPPPPAPAPAPALARAPTPAPAPAPARAPAQTGVATLPPAAPAPATLAPATLAPATLAPATLAPTTQTPVGQPLAAPMRTASAAPAQTRTVVGAASFGTTPAFNAGGPVRPGLSDEQDFNAVAQRESIESDRERLARQRAQYQVIEVTSVPDASVSGGPNIVAFALSTRHPVGTQAYRRANPLRWGRWENACLQFTNQDAAQLAFLERGGPERDRDNLDPDGDGYACWWDPTPLRQALAAAN